VPTFLSLSTPEPRDSAPLLAHLLDNRAGTALSGPLHGAPVLLASRLTAGANAVVELDSDPQALPPHAAVRYDLHPANAELPDALSVTLPASRTVFVRPGRGWVQRLQSVLAAGHDAGLPAEVSQPEVADFLAVLAHAEVGFVARADDGAGVVRVLCATVAALRGDDVRSAWQRPQLSGLRAVPAPAARALREVLRSVEVPDAASVQAELAAMGLP